MPKILIADDNEEMLDTLSRIFSLYEFDVIKAIHGQDAIEKAEETQPDIIILDGMMPIMDGFEACKILKKQEITKEIPVVFLTANFMELRDRIKGLELGADDYLLKPFNSKELVARINSILKRTELTKKLKEDNKRLLNQNTIIKKELDTLLDQHSIAGQAIITDADTGLYNYEFFKKSVNTEMLRAQRFKTELSLLLIHFSGSKKIKEILGGQLFNYLVIKIANFILNKTRAIDFVSFDAENGFFIMLPQTDKNGAAAKAEKITKALYANEYIDGEILKTLEFSKKKLSDISKLSFSFGAVTLNADETIPKVDDFLQNAEEDLKRNLQRIIQ